MCKDSAKIDGTIRVSGPTVVVKTPALDHSINNLVLKTKAPWA